MRTLVLIALVSSTCGEPVRPAAQPSRQPEIWIRPPGPYGPECPPPAPLSEPVWESWHGPEGLGTIWLKFGPAPEGGTQTFPYQQQYACVQAMIRHKCGYGNHQSGYQHWVFSDEELAADRQSFTWAFKCFTRSEWEDAWKKINDQRKR